MIHRLCYLRLLLFKIPALPCNSIPDHPCPGLAIRAIPEPFSLVPSCASCGHSRDIEKIVPIPAPLHPASSDPNAHQKQPDETTNDTDCGT
jgi:hypothetical protein